MSRKSSLGRFCILLLATFVLAGCGQNKTATEASPEEDAFTQARLEMVANDIAGAGITDENVLRAIRTVPRHKFVPSEYLEQAYENHPLPIGYGQTISQPFVVAWMTIAVIDRLEVIQVEENERKRLVIPSRPGKFIFQFLIRAPARF